MYLVLEYLTVGTKISNTSSVIQEEAMTRKLTAELLELRKLYTESERLFKVCLIFSERERERTRARERERAGDRETESESESKSERERERRKKMKERERERERERE